MIAHSKASSVSSVASAAQPVRVAIVGAGPAGCYTAQFLSRLLPASEIAVIDSSRVPYGLVRYGIAPDHPGNKAVTRQFDKMFQRGNIDFYGGIEVGSAISYRELAESCDALVLATGMERDLQVLSDGASTVPMVGAGALMRALNGDPSSRPFSYSPAGSDVVVVGNGNVSLDVVRMLVARDEHFAGLDVDSSRLSDLRQRPVRHVNVLGRRSVSDAKFDVSVLKELVTLPGVAVRVEGLSMHETGPLAEVLSDAESTSPEPALATVTFWFSTTLTGTVGSEDGRNTAVFDCDGEERVVPVDTVYSAIGFGHSTERPDQSDLEGRPDVYPVGWRRRGARGGLADNRRCAKEVAERIARDLAVVGNTAGAGASAGVARSLRDTLTQFASVNDGG